MRDITVVLQEVCICIRMAVICKPSFSLHLSLHLSMHSNDKRLLMTYDPCRDRRMCSPYTEQHQGSLARTMAAAWKVRAQGLSDWASLKQNSCDVNTLSWKAAGGMLGYFKILIFHLKYMQILSTCNYFFWNICKFVPADPTLQYFIENMSKCVPVDPACQYSIRNMCNLFCGHWKLCFRLGRQCVLHKTINICFEKQYNDTQC